MRSTLFSLVVLALCAHFTASVPCLQAQTDPNEYETLIDRALAAFEAARYPEARSLFEAAHALQPGARTLRGLGLIAFQQHDYNLARHELSTAMASTLRPLTPVQRVELAELLAWMTSELATLKLELSPLHATAEVDERVRSPGEILLDPGEHELHVRAEGHQPHTQKLTLGIGQTLTLQLKLQPVIAATGGMRVESPHVLADHAPSAPEASGGVFTRWWFWSGVGAVVVGAVIVGIVIAQSSESAYEPGGINGVVQTLRFQ